MSINTAHANGGVLIFWGERILIYCDGVEMSFEAESSVPNMKGKKRGTAYLTTHRVIFHSKEAKDNMQSFSMPFYTMKGVELEQPVFGANYIKGKVIAEGNGNWEGSAKWKMWFNKGGAIDFGRAMLKAGQMASRYTPQQLPTCAPPSAPYYLAPPAYYAAPQGETYAFVPHQTFPEPPPYDSVYMMQAPPPYPGIDPSLAQNPPPQQNGQPIPAGKEPSGAYYNPENPNNVYMPAASAPPTYAPPPYSDDQKKGQ